VEYALVRGKTAARRAAARALAEFQGVRANALALHALRDKDPLVQAALIRQLRGRGVPGVVGRLIALADSPHPAVRQAVMESLDEFRFERFLGNFDTLDESSRRGIGMMVKKVDTSTVPRLREELRSPARGQRMRALRMVRAMDLIETLESWIVKSMEDEDHLVRLEAVQTLSESRSPSTEKALNLAARDRSTAVAEAAIQALRTRGLSVPEPKPLVHVRGGGS